MSNGQKNNEEEVDLGSLFVIIGNGFSKFFKFIGSIFKSFFDFFIQILLFFKGNFIKLSIATIIGAGFGGFLEYYQDSVYSSEMIVQPNFNSTKQLYTNIEYFNSLAKQKNKTKLSSFFGLSLKEATSLKSFKIEPIVVDKDIVKSYNKVITSIDTLASKNYSYDDFKESFTDVDYYTHIIKIKSTQNDIFSKFNSTILKGIDDNSYFKAIQKATIDNINRSETIYKNSLKQVDSLRKLYAKVLLEESKRSVAETTIDMGSKDLAKPKEIELFSTVKGINNDLRSVNNERSQLSEIVNVVSYFQAIGAKQKGILGNKYLKFSLLGMLLMTVYLLFIKLNTFLNKYNNN